MNDIKYDIDDFDLYDDENMQFIWGIKSWDDIISSGANLYTMNDIDLVYLKDKNKYVLGVETFYNFEREEDELNYYKRLLDSFTKFMVDNEYDTSKRPFCVSVFAFNIDSEFDSIEDCYAMFKMLVNGYCSL